MFSMRTWKRRTLIGLAVIVGFAGAAYYWELGESPAPQGRFDLDLSEVRRLAESMPGARPVDIRVERVADFRAPAAAIVAGDGWRQETLQALSYQLVYPDHTVILDTAMDQAQAKAMGAVSKIYQDAYDRMIQAMSKAQLILITHEHPDHIGGLAAHPELLRLARLTREQVDNPAHMLPARFPENAFQGYPALIYDRYFAAAPGVVLIKSPGHSPGSQMIFVTRQGGVELLFLGDVAWSMRNVTLLRERPRYVANMLDENRAAVMRQLATLHALTQTDPKLNLIPGHDGGPVAALLQRGLFHEKFQ